MKSRLSLAFVCGLIGSFGIFTGATLAIAATTISADINTGGNLSVTGHSAFGTGATIDQAFPDYNGGPPLSRTLKC
jgi:hypothetical protein